MNVLPDMYICPLEKKSALFSERTVKCTHLAAQQTEINKGGAIANIRIKVESDAVKH